MPWSVCPHSHQTCHHSIFFSDKLILLSFLAVKLHLWSTSVALNAPLAYALTQGTVWVDLYVCSMDGHMSNVMRSEMEGGGWEAVSLQGHLTGVTLTADWLIPCPLSYPMMLRGRIAPKVICANTWRAEHAASNTTVHTRLPLILGKAWGIVTFPFKLL